MISYALISSIVSLAFPMVQIGVYSIELFKAEGDITSGGIGPHVLFYGSVFLELAPGVCTIVLCVIGVSEVQGFGTGKSILNLLLPVLVLLHADFGDRAVGPDRLRLRF
ncbi:MAG: hypothetical protein WBA12_10190 [Catalinimonas sp.]